jgi:hypothetical protein
MYSDHSLIYFENNQPKNVINIERLELEDGEKSDIFNSGLKSRDGEEAVALHLSLANDSREKMRIVFESSDEAHKFCLLLMYGTGSQSAVMRYVQRKDWTELAAALAGPTSLLRPITRLTLASLAHRCPEQCAGDPAWFLS